MNNGKFFECNLPLAAPEQLVHKDLIKDYVLTAVRITERHATLQEALELSGMKPETFQRITSKLFKDEEKEYGNVRHFDAMTPERLASYAKSVYVGVDDSEKRLTWPNAEVLCDAAYATEEEWAKLLRLIGIGGSESAVVAGVSPYNTKQKLYHVKRGDPQLLQTENKQCVFDRGHYLEDNVIASFCRRTGAVRIRDTRMFRSRKYPHCIADIDAVLRFPDDTIYLFEAKTTVMENRDAWKNGKVPAHYVTQTRHYAGILDDERVKGVYIGCHFIVDLDICGDYVGSQYKDEKFFSRIIERDEEAEDEVLSADERFWNGYVLAGKEPEPSGDAEKDLEVQRMYQGPADPSIPVITLTEDMKEAARDYIRLSSECSKLEQKKKELQTRRDAIKLRFGEVLGQATEARIELGDGGYYAVSYKPVSRLKADVDALQAYFPEAFSSCVTEETEAYRTFSIKEKNEKGRTIKPT